MEEVDVPQSTMVTIGRVFKFPGSLSMRPLNRIPALLLLVAGCSGDAADPIHGPADSGQSADLIVRDSLIVDTHIDVPYRLQKTPDDVTAATEGGDFDYPRAVAGGLDVAFMSIYTPADIEDEGGPFAHAEMQIDMVERIAGKAPDKYAIATSTSDVRTQFSAGLVSLPLGMENGSPIGSDLANVAYFYDRGIRYITLTHSKNNLISDSSYEEADNRRWNGLSEFGADVVREMNRLGIMVDISHVSDDAFWQVLEITAAPVIASHSSARHFTPGWERNMSDAMIEALAANGGVIMINFGSAFLTEEANLYSRARSDAEELWREQHPDVPEEEAEETHHAIWAEEHGPYPFADVSDVLDHIDHVVALVGVDHVGIGSDYDGVGDSLPTGLKDVSSYPNLVKGLLARGYSPGDIRKILGENLMRVWTAVEENAAAAS